MVDSEVGWLGVVVAPGGEVILSLARAAVDLDLDTPDLHHHISVRSSSGVTQSSEQEDTYWRTTIGGVGSRLEVVTSSPTQAGHAVLNGHLSGSSVHQGLLLQEKHGVGGGGRGQTEEGESDLHGGWRWTEV